jgi:hypothetical protein
MADDPTKALARTELLERLTADERAALEAAEKEHGEHGRKIAVIVTDEGAVIVKRPHRLVVKAFFDAGTTKFEELEKVAKHSLVYPSKEAFSKLLDEQPGAAAVVASEALLLAGAGAKTFSGK